jgi:hypothetical protein
MYILRAAVNTKFYSTCGGPDNYTGFIDWNDGERKLSMFDRKLLPVHYTTDQINAVSDVNDTSDDILICSEKFISCLDDNIFEKDIELIPATIFHKKSNKKYAMWIMHILNIVEIINKKKSLISQMSLSSMTFYLKIILNDNRIDSDHDIFKEKDLYHEYIISDRLAKRLVNAGLTGMEVLDLKNYYNPIYLK